MKKSNLRLLPFLLTIPSIGFSSELPLANFLKEVEVSNQSLMASKSTIEGLELRASEGKLIFRPSIYAQGQTSIDKKPTTNINAQGDQTDYSFGTVGLMQQFDFGLKGKLGYTISNTEIYHASSSFLPVPKFNDSQIALELSQSLWRNFNGIEGKSQAALLESDVKAKKLIEEYKIKNILSSAETVYWSLSQMKKMVQIQKESLDRAYRIKKWAENRSNSGLGDKSDVFQSDANVKFREYEYKTTEQQVKNLTRSFNSLRNINSENLDANLESIDKDTIKNLKLADKAALRSDTKAAIELANLSRANLELSIEKNRPTFELYGSYAMNGRNVDQAEAIKNGFKTDHTTTAIGLKFSAPLDFSNLIDNIRGYKKEQTSAELTVKQKLFDQDREWSDLVSKFLDAKTNLDLVEKMEEAQKIKTANEQDRLKKGRTTTYQVLTFEQDYAQSELLKIKSELEILTLFAQSKTFSEGSK